MTSQFNSMKNYTSEQLSQPIIDNSKSNEMAM